MVAGRAHAFLGRYRADYLDGSRRHQAHEARTVRGRNRPGVLRTKMTLNQAMRASLSWQELMFTGEKGAEHLSAARAATPPKPQPRAKPQRREAPILKEVLHALKAHPLVQECWRQQAGQVPVNGGFIRLGNKGKLDIAGRLKAGARYFEIEVKAPGRKPEPHQQARIDYVRQTGGVSGFCTSIAEALEIIE